MTDGPDPNLPTAEAGSSPAIGKIERVPLRDVWRHEAHNLTTWLEENIDVLNDVLDLELTNVERERAAGSFSADLVAEDSSGGTVVIENQLERSNHDHLGKLITYVSFVDARAAVWIVADPRPEHVRAVSWLNEGSSSDPRRRRGCTVLSHPASTRGSAPAPASGRRDSASTMA